MGSEVRPVRVAVFGCGFWAGYQVAGWSELSGVEVVAVCDPGRERAEALASRFGGVAAYGDGEELLRRERVDVVDVISDVGSHPSLVRMAAAHGLPVICQKPLAPSLAEASALVDECRAAGVPLFVHENWRWQAPIRALKRTLDEGRIGEVFRARIDFLSGFPVFSNQPALRELDQFILADLGTHLLDAARFLFGEARTLYCQAHKIHAGIRGEDVATVLMKMEGGATIPGGATVACNMAYAENFLERDHFPQTCIFVEGTRGSVELAADYWVRVTTSDGTHSRRYPPARYPWADPAYDVVQSSIVACCANLLAAIRLEGVAETTGEDNLRTLRLVFGAYEAAESGSVVRL